MVLACPQSPQHHYILVACEHKSGADEGSDGSWVRQGRSCNGVSDIFPYGKNVYLIWKDNSLLIDSSILLGLELLNSCFVSVNSILKRI